MQLHLHAKVVELGKIKVGAVSYLNTRPLVYGVLRSAQLMQEMELREDYPARIAEMLIHDEIDLGLVPVAVIPRLPQAFIVSDYCIGADGPVASVCLFSEVPVEEVETVLLDYQSRTSVNLARVLLKEYWRRDVKLEAAEPDFRARIQGTTAAVVIGDRAFEQRQRSRFSYDLAEAWKAYTGLPFVFAAWVANKPLPPAFLQRFNEANAYGVQHPEEVLEELRYNLFDLHAYYTQYISYPLTAEKRKGLELFLQKLQSL